MAGKKRTCPVLKLKPCECGCGALVQKRFVYGHYDNGRTYEEKFGKERAAEIRAKVSAISKARYDACPEIREIIKRNQGKVHPMQSQQVKEMWQRPGFKEAWIAKRKAWAQTEDGLRYRARLSKFMTERQRRLWSDPSHPYNSQCYREKIGSGRIGNTWRIGCHQTEESNRKNSESHRKLWENPDYAIRNIRSNNREPNGQEIRLSYIIRHSAPHVFRYNGDGRLKFAIPHHIPDWVNDDRTKVIELLGDYWHGPKRRHRDNSEEEARIRHDYAKHGIDCLPIWERHLDDKELVKLAVREFANAPWVLA